MHETDPDDVIVARGGRRLLLIVAILAAAVVCTGVMLWQMARPRYAVHTTSSVGVGHVALVVAYPTDWTMDAQGDRSGPTFAAFTLTRLPASRVQRWLDEHIWHAGADDAQHSRISVSLLRVDSSSGLDREQRRLEPGLRMLTRLGGRYSVTRTRYPVGPALDLQIEVPNLPPHEIGSSVLVFPAIDSGEPQYEIAVGYYATARLKARVRQVALDVVSRLRLVQVQEKASSPDRAVSDSSGRD